MAKVWMKHSCSPASSAHTRPWLKVPRFMMLAITGIGLAAWTTPQELTAAEAAKYPGQYVHVRATVVGFRTERANLCVLSLDRTGPKCPLFVVVKPELVSKLQLPPAKLKGRVVLVQPCGL